MPAFASHVWYRVYERRTVTDEVGGARKGDYRGARIGAAGTLVAVVVFSIVIDAFSPEYEASPIILAALLGTIITLLGLEVRSIAGGNGK